MRALGAAGVGALCPRFAASSGPAAVPPPARPRQLAIVHASAAPAGQPAGQAAAAAVAASGRLGRNAAAAASSKGEALTQSDYSLFVKFLHMASPYVAGHRGRIFVVVIPGEVVVQRERLYPLLEGGCWVLGAGRLGGLKSCRRCLWLYVPLRSWQWHR